MLSLRNLSRRGLRPLVAAGMVCPAAAGLGAGAAPPGLPGEAYRRVVGEGILARTLDVTPVPSSGLEVETWQLLVPARRAADGGASLPGGAVLEVLSGRGSVRTEDQVREVGPGWIGTLDQGAKIAFDNSAGEAPTEWRITLIRRRVR